MRARRLIVLFLIVAMTTLGTSSGQLAAHINSAIPETTSVPMLLGTTRPLSAASGNQTNPHVACNLTSYTNDDLEGVSSIRIFDFASNSEFVIPGNGLDRLSDTDGHQVAVTELGASGDQIFIYDLASHTTTQIPGVHNLDPAIANNVVAFVHGNFSSVLDIGVYDEATSTTTQLTNDGLLNYDPAISPDGNVVVWKKCQVNGFGCDIYEASKTGPGAFTTRKLTGVGEDIMADTDGQLVAYISDKSGENDIYIERVDGSNEKHLAVPGDQRDVRISGKLISFESKIGFEWDVFLYDLSTARLYQVTNTDRDESLADVVAGCDGINRIVYVTPGTFGDWDLWQTEFQLHDSIADQLNDLIELVQSFSLHDGTESSLISKLQEALTAVNTSDTATACSSLTAFTNAGQAQSGKKLTVDQINQLIEAASEIKTDLGCQ